MKLANTCAWLHKEMTPFRFLSSTDDYLLLLWCSRSTPELSDIFDESVVCVSSSERLPERDAAKSSRISLCQVSPETQMSHATTCTTLLCFNSIRVIRASPLAQALEFATPGLVLL
eukprot:5188-Heterococcus_DN1.PRE.2